MAVNVASGAWVAIEGVVTSTKVQIGKNGAFVVGDVVVETGDQYRCVWWIAAAAPSVGSRVAIRGSGLAKGDVSVVTTTLLDSVDQPMEHRLFDYYRSCLEAEVRNDGPVALSSRALLALSTNRAPFGAEPIELGNDAASRRWLVARQVAGRAEQLAVCWPVFIAAGSNGVELTPILRMEAEVTNGHLLLQPGTLQIDDDFLVRSGLTEDERDTLIQSAGRAVGVTDQDHAEALLALLVEWDLIPHAPAPSKPEVLNTSVGVQFSMVALALTTAYSAVIRRLVTEFEELKARPVTELRGGPLGIMLGGTGSTTYPVVRVTPSVVPSNLEQEQAITAALRCPLTVVTGPPGTGKSQVLTNTVAAALAVGERVLLASKNNHAIDVVTERVNKAHPDAHVIRLGNQSQITPAATAIGKYLHRVPSSNQGLNDAATQWAAVESEASGPYDSVAERYELRRSIGDLEEGCDRLKAALPAGVVPLEPTDESDFLAAALARASTSLMAADAVSGRWRRRRKVRQLHLVAREHTRKATNLVPARSVAALELILDGAGCGQALDTIQQLLVIENKSNELGRLRTNFELLPDFKQIERQVAESFTRRLSPAADLFGAHWRYLLQDPAARARAAVYQVKLSLAASAGGAAVYQARDSAAGAMAVLPVWAVTSLAVGGVLPLQRDLFDLVIIDEAAQCDLASAIPLLYRAKRAMIIGDPNQLSHITSVGRERDEALARFHGLDEGLHGSLGYEATSLYAAAVAASVAEPIFLRHHFRSHPHIAEFVSATFYGGGLSVDTPPDRFLKGAAVSWVDVSGSYERGPAGRSAINRAEAEQALEALSGQLEELQGSGRSVGIVSPFRAQVDHIRDRIASFMPHLAGSVTVDTAHGFQGDERDVMILSPVVSAEMPEYLQRVAGRPNLVNVAITRARARLIVVGDERGCLASGTVLADLALYIRALSS